MRWLWGLPSIVFDSRSHSLVKVKLCFLSHKILDPVVVSKASFSVFISL